MYTCMYMIHAKEGSFNMSTHDPIASRSYKMFLYFLKTKRMEKKLIMIHEDALPSSDDTDVRVYVHAVISILVNMYW